MKSDYTDIKYTPLTQTQVQNLSFKNYVTNQKAYKQSLPISYLHHVLSFTQIQDD